TWWMSATLDATRLETIDNQASARRLLRVHIDEFDRKLAGQRLTAKKALTRAGVFWSAATRKDYADDITALVLKEHKAGTLTLIIVNRVDRALAIFDALANERA